MIINIAITFDENYILPASVFLRSLIYNKKKDSHYSVFCIVPDSFPQSKIDELQDEYLGPDSLHQLVIIKMDNRYNKFHTEKHLPVAAYYRMSLPSILKDISRCLYFDADIIIEDDLTDLFNEDLQGKMIGAVPHPGYYEKKKLYGYKFEKGHYFNSGMLLLDLDKMRRKKIEKELYSLVQNNIFRCLDQDAFNIACFKDVKYFHLEYNFLITFICGKHKVLATEYYNNQYLTAKNAPKIIHYANVEKPWSHKGVKYESKWLFYYNITRLYNEGYITKRKTFLITKLINSFKYCLFKVMYKIRKSVNP